MNTKEILEKMKFLTSFLLLKIYISVNGQCRYYSLKSFPENKEIKIYIFFEKVRDYRQEIYNHLKTKKYTRRAIEIYSPTFIDTKTIYYLQYSLD